eukprot:GHVT01039895.1.p1 GENE.GHVT01039895.1~~GHVT01039895.1.p1  ORF type:complete len:124 (-),score=7.53 GHVT01039895.1:216-587(-)
MSSAARPTTPRATKLFCLSSCIKRTFVCVCCGADENRDDTDRNVLQAQGTCGNYTFKLMCGIKGTVPPQDPLSVVRQLFIPGQPPLCEGSIAKRLFAKRRKKRKKHFAGNLIKFDATVRPTQK